MRVTKEDPNNSDAQTCNPLSLSLDILMFKFNDCILGNTGKLVVRKGGCLLLKSFIIMPLSFIYLRFDSPMTGKTIVSLSFLPLSTSYSFN